MPMLKYFQKSTEPQLAIVTKSKEGSTIMKIKGEDEDFPGFPRSHVLYGGQDHGEFTNLSKLKHLVKNDIFNYIWYGFEQGKDAKEMIGEIKAVALPKAYAIFDTMRYDMIPAEKMFPGVRELWNAFDRVQARNPARASITALKEVLCFLLQEDDGYRLRVQWMVEIFNPSSWWFKLLFHNLINDFMIALEEMEHAEVVGDMKERIALLRKGLQTLLSDEIIKTLFLQFCKEMNWNKLKLSKADKYHFRPKYFKVDWLLFEY